MSAFLATLWRNTLLSFFTFLWVSTDTFCDRQLIRVVRKHTRRRTNARQRVHLLSDRENNGKKTHIFCYIYIIYHTLYVEIGIPKGWRWWRSKRRIQSLRKRRRWQPRWRSFWMVAWNLRPRTTNNRSCANTKLPQFRVQPGSSSALSMVGKSFCISDSLSLSLTS